MKRVLCLAGLHRTIFVAFWHRYPGGYRLCLRCGRRFDQRDKG